MVAGLAAREHRRARRLDRDDPDPGSLRAQHLADAGDRTARADAGDERVELGSCSRISGPVVRRWASGLAGLLNCCGMYQSGCSASSSSARRMAPCMPLVSGVSSSCGAVGQEQRAALLAHGVGHREDQAIALDRGDQREADAGVAAGRLDDGAAGT